VEFDDRDPCDVQWVNLTDSSVFQSVYINTGLVWARRSLKASGRNSVVGWPARVSCNLTICNDLVFRMPFTIVIITLLMTTAKDVRALLPTETLRNENMCLDCCYGFIFFLLFHTVFLILCWGRCLQTNGCGRIF